jgi:hypothetical protein
VLLAAPALQLRFLARYAVNVFAADEWDLYPFLRAVHEGENWWPWVFRQHNEHRVAAMRVPLALIAEWSNWNVVPEMYLGFLLQAVAVLGLWRLFARVTGRDPLRFAPLAVASFGLVHFTLFLIGMMFVWNLMLATAIWSLWWLSRQDWAGFAGAAALALVGSFTINNGLLVWPIGWLVLWLGRDRGARRWVWLAIGVAVFAFYYRGYVHPGHHPPLAAALREPVESAVFFLVLLGAPFGGGSHRLSAIMGVAVLAFLLAAGWSQWRGWRSWRRDQRVMLGLLLFALVSAAAVTVSRVVLSPGFALEPRYASFTLLVPAAAYFFWLDGPRPRSSLRRATIFCAVAVLALGFARSSVDARGRLGEWSRLRQRQAAQIRWNEALSDQDIAGLHPHVANVRQAIDYMRANHLSVFAPGAAPPRPPPR